MKPKLDYYQSTAYKESKKPNKIVKELRSVFFGVMLGATVAPMGCASMMKAQLDTPQEICEARGKPDWWCNADNQQKKKIIMEGLQPALKKAFPRMRTLELNSEMKFDLVIHGVPITFTMRAVLEASNEYMTSLIVSTQIEAKDDPFFIDDTTRQVVQQKPCGTQIDYPMDEHIHHLQNKYQ